MFVVITERTQGWVLYPILKNDRFGVRRPMIETHVMAVWPLASHLTCLRLNLISGK